MSGILFVELQFETSKLFLSVECLFQFSPVTDQSSMVMAGLKGASATAATPKSSAAASEYPSAA